MHNNKKVHDLVIATTCAIDDLPILSRLEFAKVLIFQNGGNKDDESQQSALVLASDVIDSVMDVLRK